LGTKGRWPIPAFGTINGFFFLFAHMMEAVQEEHPAGAAPRISESTEGHDCADVVNAGEQCAEGANWQTNGRCPDQEPTMCGNGV
jgi:hypothetical protein